MKNSDILRRLLKQIDRKPYPFYKDIKGQYNFEDYVLSIDHVQGDPFAAPSKLSIHLTGQQAQFPQALYLKKVQKVALEDTIIRTMGSKLNEISSQHRGSGKSGLFFISKPGQEILERSCLKINPQNGNLTVYFGAGFPAYGRTINSRELEYMLFTLLPQIAHASLYYESYDPHFLQHVSDLAEDQEAIRNYLNENNFLVFIANGSLLPRKSGVCHQPMLSPPAIPFKSPESLEIEIKLPHFGAMKGMAIPKGVSLIIGGGYHGKSTLLEAIQLGVYNHIDGDGRTFVITNETAVKIRAEDGRFVKNVDISLFINNLPNGKDTVHFSSDDASGSTSQAANVMEAIEAGTKLLLIDEDTSATNFMVRDELMEKIVSPTQEPITPYISRIRELYEKHDISTIIVAGSSGAFFHKADVILLMNQYIPEVVTELAKTEAQNYPLKILTPPVVIPSFNRIFRPSQKVISIGRFKTRANGTHLISINNMDIDTSSIEQLIDQEQSEMLILLLKYAETKLMDGKKSLIQVVDELENAFNTRGFDFVYDDYNRSLRIAKPRRYEIFACLNRFREL